MPVTAQMTPKIGARLGQLILLLNSTHDGEKIAACSAIMRTLGSAGLDLHALADVVRGSATGERPQTPPFEEMSPQDKADWCLSVGATMLTTRERDFLQNIIGARYPLSDKQSAWLEAIVARLIAARVP